MRGSRASACLWARRWSDRHPAPAAVHLLLNEPVEFPFGEKEIVDLPRRYRFQKLDAVFLPDTQHHLLKLQLVCIWCVPEIEDRFSHFGGIQIINGPKLFCFLRRQLQPGSDKRRLHSFQLPAPAIFRSLGARW